MKSSNLLADRLNEGWHRVTDAGDRDARADVEQLVAVDVDEDRSLGALDVHRESDRETGAHDGLATLVKGLRLGPGHIRDDLALGAD